jgi:hypothetical protein
MNFIPWTVGLLVIPGLIIFGVVALVRRARRSEAVSSPAEILAYLLVLAAVVVAINSLSTLIETLFPGAKEVLFDRGSIALALASLIVSGPVALGMWSVLERRRHTEERPGRTLYLSGAIGISLVWTSVAAIRLGWWAIGRPDFPSNALGDLIAFGAAWWLHEWLRGRSVNAGPLDDLRALVGSGTGLVISLGGAGFILGSSLQSIYDTGAAVIEGNPLVEDVATGAVMLAVGVPLSLVYWLRGLIRGRGPVRSAYLTFVATAGMVTLLSAAAVIANLGLQALTGLHEGSLRAHFRPVVASLTALILAAFVWWHHRRAMGQERTPSVRVYAYVLAGLGLVVGTGSVITLVAVLVDELTVGGTVVSAELVFASLVALAVAAGLVARFWTTAIRLGSEAEERRSGVRKLMTIGVLTIAAVAALIGLIIVIFQFLRAALDGELSLLVISQARVALATALVGAGLAAHLATVVRSDRRAEGERKVVKRTVTVVCSDPGPLPDLIPGLRVLKRADGAGVIDQTSAGAIAEAVSATEAAAILVMVDAGGHVVVPLV